MARRPTDVALVLSVCNSLVLLAMLAGLSAAAWLARTGQLESALAALAAPAAGAGLQGLFALVSAFSDVLLLTCRAFWAAGESACAAGDVRRPARASRASSLWQVPVFR